MPFVKDSLSLLIEASDIDTKRSSKSILRESAVRSSYKKIKKAANVVKYGPEIVPVIKMSDGKYYTEMNFLHPYMKSAGISSIVEALNNVALANDLDTNSVGLLIESDECVGDCISKAVECADPKRENSVLNKIDKAVSLSDKLESKGIAVRTKQEEICPECGKVKCECKK
jgi:hypothetical protein